MKKKLKLVSIVIITAAMVACVFGCNDPAVEPEGLCSVSFGNDSAIKALGANVGNLDIEETYWYYTAVKADGGPAPGKTGNVHDIDNKQPVAVDGNNNPAPGITGKVVTGFGTGKWTFRLYGCDGNGNVTFSSPWPDGGTSGTEATLELGKVVLITVPVQPELTTGSGYLQFSGITAETEGGGSPVLKFRYKTWVSDAWSTDWTVDWTVLSQPKTTDLISSEKCLVEVGAFYTESGIETLKYREQIVAYVYEDKTTVISGTVDTEFQAIKITYDGNGNTGGSVPVDSSEYGIGDTVTVLGNTESLTKDGKVFDGWNTVQNCTASDAATHYDVGRQFKISENTTLYAHWIPEPSSTTADRVGGRLFYSTGTEDTDGATYIFYDYNGTPVGDPNPTTAEIKTTTYDNVWSYSVVNAPPTDRYYVYENTLGNGGLVSGKEWGACGTGVGSGTFTTTGQPHKSPFIPSAVNGNAEPRLTVVGTGELNTEACLGFADSHPTTHPNPFESGEMVELYGTNTIWVWLRDTVRANKVGGCNDWFIPSTGELDQLRSSGLVNWFDYSIGVYIWSSVESDGTNSYYWIYDSGDWGYITCNKSDAICSVVAVRAF